MVLGLLLTAVRKLSEWLSTDALKFEFLLIQDKETKPLGQEGALLEMLLREQIANDPVKIRHFADDPSGYAEHIGQRSMCHLLAISSGDVDVQTETAIATELTVDGPRPEVRIGKSEPMELNADYAVECWTLTLERLLMVWV